jgi:hypothetical protein
MILNHSDLMALKNDETAAVAAHPRRATAVPLALEPERGSRVTGKGPKKKCIPSPKYPLER